MLCNWWHLLREAIEESDKGAGGRCRRSAGRIKACRLVVEALEDRLLLAVFTVNSLGD
jgi:hypothetical protein